MTSKRALLNSGRQPIPSPPVVTPENEQYGQVYDELLNDANAGGGAFGDFFARIPRTETGISVTSDTVTLTRRGSVVAAQATAGNVTGPVEKRITGGPSSGQVRVSYNSSGFPTLIFNGGDAVTECAVEQLSPPEDIDTMLSVDLPPP